MFNGEQRDAALANCVYVGADVLNRDRVANRPVASEYRGGAASTEPANTPHVSAQKSVYRIVNPPDSVRVSVSLKHLKRWIKDGDAEVIGPGLVRLSAKKRSYMMGRPRKSTESGLNYDQIRRMMRSDEKQHIPLKRLPEHTRHFPVGGRSPQTGRLIAAHVRCDGKVRSVRAGDVGRGDGTGRNVA